MTDKYKIFVFVYKTQNINKTNCRIETNNNQRCKLLSNVDRT